MNELLNAYDFDWNEEMIKDIFWEDEAKAILSIPLGSSNTEDKLIWALVEGGKREVNLQSRELTF